MILDDARTLKEEAAKFIYEHSAERWLKLHTMDYAFPSADGRTDRTVLKVAAGEIDADLSQWAGALQDLTPPPGLSPFDAAAFHSAASRQRDEIRLRISALNTIRSRLKTRCLNYAIQIEKQHAVQERNQAFLWSVENDVNNYFKESSIDVYQKLQKASLLASSHDAEDGALMLTEVRRALKSAADHFYPPSDAAVVCSDGRERVLGDDRYLNRLNEFLATRMANSAARDLAKAELALLDAFMRRLNDLASKGVHAEVSPGEARQGLVGTFMFLSTVIRHASTHDGAPRNEVPR